MSLLDNWDFSEGKICKLKKKKSMYGLKSAPKYWYENFNIFILSQCFIRSENHYGNRILMILKVKQVI